MLKFTKLAAIAASVLALGIFSSCSDFSEGEKTAIVIQLPGCCQGRSVTTKGDFKNSLSYEIYLTQEYSDSLNLAETNFSTFFSAVETFFKSFTNVQKKTGKASDIIEFTDLEEGTYTISIYYASEKYNTTGHDSKTVSIKQGKVENVGFNFKYPESVLFADYTAISNAEDINNAITNLSAQGVDYPNESTYTKFYLTQDIEIDSQIKIETPESDSYGILIDLNGHTVKGKVSDSPLLSAGENTNIVIKNGTIETESAFIEIQKTQNSNGATTLKLDGVKATAANGNFTMQNDGIVVLTGGTTINSAKVSGGLFLMLGGTAEELTQTTGSVAMIESAETEGVTFNTTGANTIGTYNAAADGQWLLVYFGGDATIENKISVNQSNIDNLKFLQMSECKSEKFAELEIESEATNAVTSNSPVFLTKFDNSPYKDFIMDSPKTEKVVLPSGYSFSEKTTQTDSCTGYMIVKK